MASIIKLNHEKELIAGRIPRGRYACVVVPVWSNGSKTCPSGQQSRYNTATEVGKGAEGIVFKANVEATQLVRDYTSRTTEENEYTTSAGKHINIPPQDRIDFDPANPIYKCRVLQAQWSLRTDDVVTREIFVGSYMDSAMRMWVPNVINRSTEATPAKSAVFVTGTRDWAIWTDPTQLQKMPHHVLDTKGAVLLDETNLLEPRVAQSFRRQSQYSSPIDEDLFEHLEGKQMEAWFDLAVEYLAQAREQVFLDPRMAEEKWKKFTERQLTAVGMYVKAYPRVGPQQMYQIGRNVLRPANTVAGIAILRQPAAIPLNSQESTLYDIFASASPNGPLAPRNANNFKVIMTMLLHQMDLLYTQHGFIHGDLSGNNIMIATHMSRLTPIWTSMTIFTAGGAPEQIGPVRFRQAMGVPSDITDEDERRRQGIDDAHFTFIDMGRAGFAPGKGPWYTVSDEKRAVIRDMTGGDAAADVRRLARHIVYAALNRLWYRADVAREVFEFCSAAIAVPLAWVPGEGHHAFQMDATWSAPAEAQAVFRPKSKTVGQFIISVAQITQELDAIAVDPLGWRNSQNYVSGVGRLTNLLSTFNHDINPWSDWICRHVPHLNPFDHASPANALRFDALKLAPASSSSSASAAVVR